MNDSLLEKYEQHLTGSELGKKSDYTHSYDPGRLYPISRTVGRKAIGIDSQVLPFQGFDCWNHYEVSWLNDKGKPMVAIAEIYYDCSSPMIVESKSLKLYFNTLNHTRFNSIEDVERTIAKDLASAIKAEVTVMLHQLNRSNTPTLHEKFYGESIDELDIECNKYIVHPNYLSTGNEKVEEILCSDLLRSNCLVTCQPDWGSIQITYKGNKINREGLLRYLVSFRDHNEFHEQCIERIFMDIMNHCKPTELTVYGRYTRRGGIDINPYRSTKKVDLSEMNFRLVRQ